MQKAVTICNRKISVIGFDNLILVVCASPTISSVDNKLEVMCVTAVDLHIKIFTGETVPQVTIFSGELIECDSFKKLKR